MKIIKVFYYDFKFWRAEVLRCGLFLQNIPFEDIRDRAVLGEMKDRAPMGAYPILEIDGQVLSQTPALAAYVGKLGGVFDYKAAGATPDPEYPSLYPSSDDIFLQAKCDEIMNACGDVTSTIGSSFGLKGDELLAKRTELINPEGGRLYKHCKGLNSILCAGAPGVACGKSLSVADICVWRLISWINGGVLDHIPQDFVSKNFSNLQAVYEACEANEKIGKYVAQYHK